MQVYEIPLEYLQKYENYFFQVADENQIVPGAQARVLFGKTQLPREQLGELWRICDLDEKGYLTKGEFIVAIHLMALCKKGIPLPQGLPDCLMVVARGGPPPAPVQRFGSNQNIGIQPRLGSNSNIGIDPRFQSQNVVQAPKRFGSNSNISIQPIQAPQSFVHPQQQFDPNQIPGFQDTANSITAQRLQINESSQQLFGMQNQFKDLFASVLAEKQDELQQYQMINDNLRTMITSLQDQYRTLSEELIKLQSQKTQLKMQNNTLQTTLHEQIQKNNTLTTQITQEIHQINQLPQAGNQFQQQQNNYLQNLTQSPNLQPQAQQQSYYSPNLQQPAQIQPVPVYSPQNVPTVQLQPIQNQIPQQPQQISGFQQQSQQQQFSNNFSPISQQKQFMDPQNEWDNQKLQGILKAPGDYQQPKKQVTIQEYPPQETYPW